MTYRDLSHAEKLVEELAECRRKEREIDLWGALLETGHHKSGVITRTVTETRILGFKITGEKENWEPLPGTVRGEFRQFLSKKRYEYRLRVSQIERELEGLT